MEGLVTGSMQDSANTEESKKREDPSGPPGSERRKVKALIAVLNALIRSGRDDPLASPLTGGKRAIDDLDARCQTIGLGDFSSIAYKAC